MRVVMVAAVVLAAALDDVVERCAPHVGPLTMRAVIAYESGNRPYAIGDNTVHRGYFPRSAVAAARLAQRLARGGHDLDLGYAQINIRNLRAYGVGFAEAFEPCTNVALGSRILRVAYARAVRTDGPGQRALVHALSIYNSGTLHAGLDYARAVIATGLQLRLRWAR